MSIYIYIYLYIFLYISRKKNVTFSNSFAKEQNVLTFFSVLWKRMLPSSRSFPFFAKERNVLLGFISRQKLKKRTEKNVTFSFLNGKDRNALNGKECGAQPWAKYCRLLFKLKPFADLFWLLALYVCIFNMVKEGGVEISM